MYGLVNTISFVLNFVKRHLYVVLTVVVTLIMLSFFNFNPFQMTDSILKGDNFHKAEQQHQLTTEPYASKIKKAKKLKHDLDKQKKSYKDETYKQDYGKNFNDMQEMMSDTQNKYNRYYSQNREYLKKDKSLPRFIEW